MNNFNDMFYKGVDNSERAYTIIDNISVLNVHKWNWDIFMQQCVIYAFINYWELYGKNIYVDRPSKWTYIGLDICYRRIIENKDMFVGDLVVNDNDMIEKTVDFIWKYKFVMWD